MTRTITINGRAYPWRDLVALRREQSKPRAEQPVLFEMMEDRRPAGQRTAAERYAAPSLFTLLDTR